ncbi:MAG TPA: glycosyl hydrolase, partial [Ardenticatenaceae bacterium]|nr:glycosyl hydrolase [Ardenticatenaceae bacterium]
MKQPHRFRPTILLAFIGLVALLAVRSARSEPGAVTIGPTDFGMTFVNSGEEPRSDARIQRGVNSGAKLDRFPLYWNFIEQTEGVFNWDKQDKALRDNERHGLGTLAILLGAPGHVWTGTSTTQQRTTELRVGGGPVRWEGGDSGPQASECTGPPAPRGLYDPIFADGTDEPGTGKDTNRGNPWARFVQLAVERYKPGGAAGVNVRYWEIWNEPDLCHFWSGSPADYARLLKVAYLVIKQIDPQATVLWAGIAHGENSPSWLADFVRALNDDSMAHRHNGFFDAAASHQYSDVTHGYNFTRRIRGALAGTPWQNKPIWITESGVPVCGSFPGPDCPSPHRATADGQAAYIWQNVFYTRLAGANGPIFHFQLHDDCGTQERREPPADAFGLITNEPSHHCVPHTAQPRLSYTAYHLATRFLAGTELLWHDLLPYNGQPNRIRRAAFYHPESKERRLLVWAVEPEDVIASVPATSESARRISVDGSETALTPANWNYELHLPGSTNPRSPGSATYIGGLPYLLVERDTLPPVTSITELDPISGPVFEVAWQAIDLGSGVEATTLFFQIDDRPWDVWLDGQPASGSAFFNGEPGKRYRYAVMARDRAGNLTPGLVAQAETLVGDGTRTTQVSGQVFDIRGQPAAGARFAIGPASGVADANGHFSLPVLMGRHDVLVNGQVVRNGQLFLDENVNLALLKPPAANAVHNGDFEAGLTGWSVSGSSPVGVEQLPRQRDEYLRLAAGFVPNPGVPGEGGDGGNSTVSQRVRVPA